eukprot:8040945-Alexandrium_andersonii.AAC.1
MLRVGREGGVVAAHLGLRVVVVLECPRVALVHVRRRSLRRPVAALKAAPEAAPASVPEGAEP